MVYCGWLLLLLYNTVGGVLWLVITSAVQYRRWCTVGGVLWAGETFGGSKFQGSTFSSSNTLRKFFCSSWDALYCSSSYLNVPKMKISSYLVLMHTFGCSVILIREGWGYI